STRSVGGPPAHEQGPQPLGEIPLPAARAQTGSILEPHKLPSGDRGRSAPPGRSGRGSDSDPCRLGQEGGSCSLSPTRSALPPARFPNAVLDAPRGSWSAGHEGECNPRGQARDRPPDVVQQSGCTEA